MANALPGTNEGKAQLFYVAYYGRPADPLGLSYWAGVLGAVGGNLATVTTQFGQSAEAQEVYGSLSVASAVNALYNQMFNRDAEPAGLAYWVGQISANLVKLSDLPIALYTGAQGTDLDAIENKLTVAGAFTEALDETAEILAYNGVTAMAPAKGLLASVGATEGSLTAAVAQIDDVIESIVNPSLPGGDQYLILTSGQDNLTAGTGNDVFLATDATLQLGDLLNGGFGNDTLNLSIRGSSYGVMLEGFATFGIENIVVKSLASGPSTLDLSDTIGVVRLESNETDGNTLTFTDIQSVNATSVTIIDTDEDHTFVYDINAYAPNNGTDTVNLTLQEIRAPGYQEFPYDGPAFPVIAFADKDGSRSDIEVMNLTSLKRPEAGPTPATSNYVGELSVGAKFDILNISGGSGVNDDADLEIEESLDEKLRVINASGLLANLTLDVVTESSVKLFVYDGAVTDETGARGVDNLDVTRTGNNDIDLASGNDDLHVYGNGNNTIVAGTGHDEVHIVAVSGDSIDDGRHLISLGDGSDDLIIEGDVDNYDTTVDVYGVTTIDAGADNDTVTIRGNGDYNITLGSGADQLRINSHVGGEGDQVIFGNDGDDLISVWADGETDANLGAGDDVFVKIGNGHDSVVAETGDDLVVVLGNGNHTVRGNDGDDAVFLGARAGDLDDLLHASIPGATADGVHNVDLGAGNDLLVINGSRTSVDNVDNIDDPDEVTIIVGGAGNDTVVVTEDHFLDVELNDGDDQLEINAKDLSVDDSLVGGSGIDTLVLQNNSYEKIDGRVLRSETAETTGFEVFDLRDNNITLHVTTEMIETSDLVENGNRKIVVSTEQAVEGFPARLLPTLTLMDGTKVAPFFNGMTTDEFDAIAANWRNGLYKEAKDKTGFTTTSAIAAYYEGKGDNEDEEDDARLDLQQWLSQQIAGNGYGDNGQLLDGKDVGPGATSLSPDHNGIDELDEVDGSLVLAADDLYYFVRDIDGAQTIDITDIETQNYRFELDGGIVRDIVVADDDSINSKSVLRFDSESAAANSTQDTLRVMNGAEITAADLRNVSGLERIELMFTAANSGEFGVGAEWGITLTEYVINQTTADAPLVIDVADNVPDNSRLYITLDASVANAYSDVFIDVNSNVTVFVRRVGETEYVEVTEPMFNTDLGPDGGRVIEVRNDFDLEFTAQGDNLVGTSEDDLFGADSLAYIQTGDSANGNGGEDTLQLNFTVNNEEATLEDIFEGADIEDIERIVFWTERNVEFAGVGAGYETALRYLETGTGDDTLTAMRHGVHYYLDAGDDSLSFLPFGGVSTVDGGEGSDSVFSRFGNDIVSIDNLEFITDSRSDDADVVTLLSNDSQATNALITIYNYETINGSSEADNVKADTSNNGSVEAFGNGGNDTISVGAGTPDDVYLDGGAGSDRLTVLATGTAEVDGDWNASAGSDGDDVINVTVTGSTSTSDNQGWVYAGGGDDLVYLKGGTNGTVEYLGAWGDYNNVTESADGPIDGMDTIDVIGDGLVWAFGMASDDDVFAQTSGEATIPGLGQFGLLGMAFANGGNGDDTVVAEGIGAAGGNSIYIVGFGMNDDDLVTVNLAGATNGSDADDVLVAEGGLGDDTVTVENKQTGSDSSDPSDYLAAGDFVLSYAHFESDEASLLTLLDGQVSVAAGFDLNEFGYSEDGVFFQDNNDTWFEPGWNLVIGQQLQANDGEGIAAFLNRDYEFSTFNLQAFGSDSVEVDLGDANEGGDDVIDVIAAAGKALDGYVVGGAGDDTIKLAGNEDGSDRIFFGDIGYDELQNQDGKPVRDFDSQGFDVITGFNFEDNFASEPAVDHEDHLDFRAFLDFDIAEDNIVWGDWTGGRRGIIANEEDDANSIVVIAGAAGDVLTAADILTPEPGDVDFEATEDRFDTPAVDLDKIYLNDNGRAVVIMSTGGLSTGQNQFDIYFVQDIDSSEGAQTWQVDHVAELTSLTLVGIQQVYQNLFDTYVPQP